MKVKKVFNVKWKIFDGYEEIIDWFGLLVVIKVLGGLENILDYK